MRIEQKRQIWLLVWIWSAFVVFLFAFLDFIETRYFPNLDRQTIRVYHLIRGGVGAAVTSILAVLFVYRQRKRLEEELIRSERFAAMGKMSSLFAHEVKSPLGSLSLNVELLEEELVPLVNGSRKETQTLLRAIMKEVERMTHITDAYLRFGHLPKQMRVPCSVEEILDHLLLVTREEAARRGVRVEKKVAENLPFLFLDKEQIHQALLNLVRNSFDAMAGGGTLTFQAKKEGEMIVLVISDTGVGMTEEERAHIFEPFFSTKAEGTGLGLTAVMQIIQEHGGEISCESAVGKGSTFLMRLPIQRKKVLKGGNGNVREKI